MQQPESGHRLKWQETVNYRAEGIISLVYFSVYLCYLSIHQESELLHWMTLVLLPFAGLSLYHRRGIGRFALRESMASVGLRKGNLRRGVIWAVALGLVLSASQGLLSRHSEEIWTQIRTGKALYLFPLVLILMLVTAGFTEEFFFRGVLQTRLGGLLGSKLWAVLLTSVLFGVYHIPYAYFDENWPSQGDWGAALPAALTQGIPMGLILGAAYERTRHNLVACVLIHSLFNSLPAMAMIKFHPP